MDQVKAGDKLYFHKHICTQRFCLQLCLMPKPAHARGWATFHVHGQLVTEGQEQEPTGIHTCKLLRLGACLLCG